MNGERAADIAAAATVPVGNAGGVTRSRAVVYVTDPGFLLPTFVSAEQVHRQVAGIADVVVAFTGFGQESRPAVEAAAEALGFRPLSMAEVALPAGTHWADGHVPPASIARLLLPAVLDPAYRSIVYIDGDTQIVGDVRPLVALDVPPGRVAAAPDCAWLPNKRVKFPDGYFANLGIADPSTYFNAGVLAFERGTFDSVMPEALAFFLANSSICQFHDQSALNALMNTRRFRLSPRYNYLTDYTHLEPDLVRPVVLHFNGHAKPWTTEGPPWDGRFLSRYRDIIRRVPALERYAPVVAPRQERPPGKPLLRAIYESERMRPVRTAVRRYRHSEAIAAMTRGYDLD